MWYITCPNPNCGFQGTLTDYEASCADECVCPKCDEAFQWEEPEDEKEYDESEAE